jgi:hypothetical protein
LPAILYGCVTWSLTLREEHRLKVFEKGVLRRIFGCKMGYIIGGWRKLHNTEVRILTGFIFQIYLEGDLYLTVMKNLIICTSRQILLESRTMV